MQYIHARRTRQGVRCSQSVRMQSLVEQLSRRDEVLSTYEDDEEDISPEEFKKAVEKLDAILELMSMSLQETPSNPIGEPESEPLMSLSDVERLIKSNTPEGRAKRAEIADPLRKLGRAPGAPHRHTDRFK